MSQTHSLLDFETRPGFTAFRSFSGQFDGDEFVEAVFARAAQTS